MGDNGKGLKQKNERLGKVGHNKFNTKMKIIEYNGRNDIWVEFQDEYKEKVHTSYQHFEKGEVKNPYDKTIFQMGFIGIGDYSKKNNNNIYSCWLQMLRRCYNFKEKEEKTPTYVDCYVCDEWHCFQNFAKWYEENYYECNDERMELDKDILIKGNKIYSPETCVFVPKRINSLFVKRDSMRGEYPIGVSYYKKTNNLVVHCMFEGRYKNLGYFSLNKPFQAFYTYKTFKENYIKQVADEYKDLIPKKLYDAMYNYQVEIND